jgi:hypothetical protein
MSAKADLLLKKKNDLVGADVIQRGYRDGIEIEKGVVLNEEYLSKNMDKIGDMMSIFSAYPDVFIDFITP